MAVRAVLICLLRDRRYACASELMLAVNHLSMRLPRWMLVRTLACARTGRSAGKVMVANRSLGNPTDRDDNGGLRNRMRRGSRTEPAWETARAATVPYRACALHFYPNNLRFLHPEGCARSWEPLRAPTLVRAVRVHAPETKGYHRT